MWILIWRGWGIVVLPIAVAAFFLMAFIAQALKPLGLPGIASVAIAGAVPAIAAAAAVWFLARALEGGPTKRLVDPESGQQYIIRRDAGHLFFVPTRYWAFVFLALGALGVGAGIAESQKPPVLSAATSSDSTASFQPAGLQQ